MSICLSKRSANAGCEEFPRYGIRKLQSCLFVTAVDVSCLLFAGFMTPLASLSGLVDIHPSLAHTRAHRGVHTCVHMQRMTAHSSAPTAAIRIESCTLSLLDVHVSCINNPLFCRTSCASAALPWSCNSPFSCFTSQGQAGIPMVHRV